MCVRPMATGLPSVLMLMRRAAAFAKMSPTFPLMPSPVALSPAVLLQLKTGGVAKAKGEGEKENECTTECKSRRRRDEKAPWALNYESGEGGGDAKGRRRGGEKRVMYV